MKKFLVLLLLVVIGTSAFARKSYIILTSNYSNEKCFVYMTGDVPDSITDISYSTSDRRWYTDKKSPAEMLNILSEYGYEVEEMGSSNNKFLLSKVIPSSQATIEGDVDKDGEVTIADVNRVINLILGIVRENPTLLKQYGK